MHLAVSLLVLVCLLLPVGVVAGERVLFDFEGGFDVATVEARDVKVTEAKREQGSALRIASGHRQAWPGIDLPAPKGKWDLSAFDYVALDVKNVGSTEGTLC